jgi:hypothetical protein
MIEGRRIMTLGCLEDVTFESVIILTINWLMTSAESVTLQLLRPSAVFS